MFKPADVATITRTAEAHGINPRALLAMGLVETNGFIEWSVDGQPRPPIRPEPHKFYEALAHRAPEKLAAAVNAGLAAKRRGVISPPARWAGVYAMFERMRQIDEWSACYATSFGWGQVMGFNYRELTSMAGKRLESPVDVYTMANGGVGGQTYLVIAYAKAFGVAPWLNAMPSQRAREQVALRWNGPAWRENSYAAKLASAWASVGNDTEMAARAARDVRELQTGLAQLGYYGGQVDGAKGPVTRQAVRAFQEDAGLVVDGVAGPNTWKALRAALAARKGETTTKRKGDATSAVSGVAVGGVALPQLAGAFDQVAKLRDRAADTLAAAGMPPELVGLVAAAFAGFLVYRFVLPRLGLFQQ